MTSFICLSALLFGLFFLVYDHIQWRSRLKKSHLAMLLALRDLKDAVEAKQSVHKVLAEFMAPKSKLVESREVVSKPNAGLVVTDVHLTEEANRGLSTGLSRLPINSTGYKYSEPPAVEEVKPVKITREWIEAIRAAGGREDFIMALEGQLDKK